MQKRAQKNAKLFVQLSNKSNKQDHLRMNVAPGQTIILDLQIFLDHRSLSSIGQKILMILHPPPFSILVVHWRWSGSFRSPIHHLFVFLSFCLFCLFVLINL